MKILYSVLISLYIVHGKVANDEKKKFCDNLDCDENEDAKVCGVKYVESGLTEYQLFDNECKLLKFGCQVDDHQTFGLINMKHCISSEDNTIIEQNKFVNDCPDCSELPQDPVCGIRPDGKGFRVRTFQSECELEKYNCEVKENFTITDYFICSNNANAEGKNEEHKKDELEIMLETNEDSVNETNIDRELPTMLKEDDVNNTNAFKNVVIVRGSVLNGRNINKSIANFFKSTLNQGIPIRSVLPGYNESTRKRMIKIFGPVKLYEPRVVKPKIVHEDYYHQPTLSSCFHKCPTKCPDIYNPVCARHGLQSRQPSVMFLNHCYMDVAQCKVFWEDKTETARSSGYMASSFVFCLGDLTTQVQFIPFLRTLQYMGRIKKRSRYRYRIKNLRYLNQNYRIMG